MDKLDSLAFYVRAHRHAVNAGAILATADSHLYPRARKLAAERLIAARAARRLALEEHVAAVRASRDWGFARTDLRGAL